MRWKEASAFEIEGKSMETETKKIIRISQRREEATTEEVVGLEEINKSK